MVVVDALPYGEAMTQTTEQPSTPVEVPAKETVDVPVDPAVAPEVETTPPS